MGGRKKKNKLNNNRRHALRETRLKEMENKLEQLSSAVNCMRLQLGFRETPRIDGGSQVKVSFIEVASGISQTFFAAKEVFSWLNPQEGNEGTADVCHRNNGQTPAPVERGGQQKALVLTTNEEDQEGAADVCHSLNGQTPAPVGDAFTFSYSNDVMPTADDDHDDCVILDYGSSGSTDDNKGESLFHSPRKWLDNDPRKQLYPNGVIKLDRNVSSENSNKNALVDNPHVSTSKDEPMYTEPLRTENYKNLDHIRYPSIRYFSGSGPYQWNGDVRSFPNHYNGRGREYRNSFHNTNSLGSGIGAHFGSHTYSGRNTVWNKGNSTSNSKVVTNQRNVPSSKIQDQEPKKIDSTTKGGWGPLQRNSSSHRDNWNKADNKVAPTVENTPIGIKYTVSHEVEKIPLNDCGKSFFQSRGDCDVTGFNKVTATMPRHLGNKSQNVQAMSEQVRTIMD